MCGIAGFVMWRKAGASPFAVLKDMADRIAHRGPDDAAFLLAGPGDGLGVPQSHPQVMIEDAWPGEAVVGMAHRRLSVIDLSQRGRQPMRQRSGSPWILYNGETYNFRQLRAELQALGHHFESTTDTEVVVAAYEQWGEAFIEKCEGMFALAIFDPAKRTLLLYRDRVGIKPLYIRQDGGGIFFGSEIKSVLAAGTERRIDHDAVSAYLRLQLVGYRPETFIRGVRELEPGSAMRIDLDSSETRTWRYWNLGDRVEARSSSLPASYDDQVRLVREQFIASVTSHLVSDVRVGSCLSGGLDSSSIVCVLNQLLHANAEDAAAMGSAISTFTSCHEDRRFDEQEYVDAVAEATSIKSFRVFPRADDLAERFDRLVWHQDEPFTSASIFAQFCLMERARAENVTVVLDGQGGDEVFAGYRKFFFFYMKDLLRAGRLPGFASEMLGALRHGDGDLFDLRAARRYMPASFKGAKQGIGQYFMDAGAARRVPGGFGSGASIRERQILDVERFSLPSLLRYEDRNSMAFGIEARVPFLDHSLIETAIALPIASKIRGGVSKSVLRDAMRGIVPEKILRRRTKMGFVTPEESWMKGPLKPLALETFTKPHEVLQGTLDMNAIEAQFSAFCSGQPSSLRARDFFRVMCLDRWAHKFAIAS